MVYLAGLAGFAGGFALGLALIGWLLRGKSRSDIVAMLTADSAARFKYGLITWGMALFGAVGALYLYRAHFGG